MDARVLARLIDHSVLKPEATEAEVRAGADIVRTWGIGYYCVQPAWVRAARAAIAGTDAAVVAVIAFPHGCDRTPVKADAARLAIDEGAREIDMVINIGALRSGAAADVEADILAVVRAAQTRPVKAIIETGALTDAEKRLACRLARDAAVAFVKTSTGFHPAGGATPSDVRLLRAEVGHDVGVKASGGIRTLEHVKSMLDAGANRIGTSASAAILEAQQIEDTASR